MVLSATPIGYSSFSPAFPSNGIGSNFDKIGLK